MAGINPRAPIWEPGTGAQLAAVMRLRWQLFVHSLQTVHGSLELVSRIFTTVTFGLAGLGGAIGMGAAAWHFAAEGRVDRIFILLWPVFFFWQFFPVTTAAFSSAFDASELLRFPLSYRGYCLLRLAYSALDPATLVGGLWLLGMAIGIGFASPGLFAWAALVLAGFALLNILLSQMIFSWIERWLAQRRSREILGIIFFLFILGFQFMNPLLHWYTEESRPEIMRVGREFSFFQQALPPGLAAKAIFKVWQGHGAEGLGRFALLGVYAAVFLWVLNLRLRAQYRGENLSETANPARARKNAPLLQTGWTLPWLSAPVVAIFEKELRYLLRSGPMLFSLIMPAILVVLFGIGPTGRGGNFLARAPAYAFPMGALYALLMLTNLVYNNFGADAGGVNFLIAAPVRFSQVVAAKNLAHLVVLGVELLLVWIVVCLMFHMPPFAVTMATLAGVLFAAPVNLAAGNLLSVYSPKKIEFGMLGRQRASQITVLASFAIQLGIFALAAGALLMAREFGTLWIATSALLLLAGFAFAGYALVLHRMDRIGAERRETLIAEMCRA